MGQSVSKALDDLPQNSSLKQFLLANKAEVTRMCITEYDEKRTMEMFREEGRVEGREEGRIEGRVEGREEGRIEGRVKGREEGRSQVSILMQKLIELKRYDDAYRAATDPEYQKELLKEFGIA